jgi:hypothetical protein
VEIGRGQQLVLERGEETLDGSVIPTGARKLLTRVAFCSATDRE